MLGYHRDLGWYADLDECVDNFAAYGDTIMTIPGNVYKYQRITRFIEKFTRKLGRYVGRYKRGKQVLRALAFWGSIAFSAFVMITCSVTHAF